MEQLSKLSQKFSNDSEKVNKIDTLEEQVSNYIVFIHISYKSITA